MPVTLPRKTRCCALTLVWQSHTVKEAALYTKMEGKTGKGMGGVVVFEENQVHLPHVPRSDVQNDPHVDNDVKAGKPALLLYFVVLDFNTKDRRFWCCSMMVSSSSLFHKPLAKISTQASCTFCQPWKRPRWLMAPMRPGHMW
mmetsp:Transcript_68590/g.143222  ORF Transcript_68590/g.143222 Transcript_68590/m.143222 type:complete len:143 (-) Transcript_68590:223-651(-)